jgi:hypothetical protein
MNSEIVTECTCNIEEITNVIYLVFLLLKKNARFLHLTSNLFRIRNLQFSTKITVNYLSHSGYA